MGYTNITLYGSQTCDYLHIQDSADNLEDFEYVNTEPKEWNESTLLSAKFNGNLVAGNSSLLEAISGYEVRKRKGSNPYTEYVGKINSNPEIGTTNYMIDYLVENKTDYTYYLYPTAKRSKNDPGITLSPNVSDEVNIDCSHWSLLIVDESEEENVFYLNKMFKFGLNLVVDDMNNNATVNIIHNFTKYPTLQYGTSNFWSSSLTALCGFISSHDGEYVQTPNMLNELKSLTSDSRRKFLKDTCGNIYEVNISAPINISNIHEAMHEVKNVKISWAEVGEVDGISIINNPNKSSENWILTETGEVVPYTEYVWDEHYRWDNSFRWTANERILNNDITNLGRDLYEGE